MARKRQIELTLEEALEEITRLSFPAGTRRTGDLDTGQLAKHWKLSQRATRDRAQKLVEAGEYQRVTIYDPESKRNQFVYRRLK